MGYFLILHLVTLCVDEREKENVGDREMKCWRYRVWEIEIWSYGIERWSVGDGEMQCWR